MIIVDTKLHELEKKGKPIRVGLIGAGFAGRGFALQLLTRPFGMRLVAISNRTISYAIQAYIDAGVTSPSIINTSPELTNAIQDKKPVVTDNPMLLCENSILT